MGMQKVQISQVPFRILDVAYITEGLIENMIAFLNFTLSILSL